MDKKRSRTGEQSRISRVFQPTIFGAQTQQQTETCTGPEQFKPLPQGTKILNGDTGNHRDLPPRGVGDLNRFKGCLLPHTNTGTIQEISGISCPGQNVSVQSTAVRFVHSSNGVHCNSQGAETDGHTKGYKDPPVPRRLVGESQVPQNLSPAHTGFSENVSRFGLSDEFSKIRTGAQTSLRVRRLPIPPQVRLGLTHTGPVAEPSRQNTDTAIPTSLSGNSYFSLRLTTYEIHRVASQRQLEGTGKT